MLVIMSREYKTFDDIIEVDRPRHVHTVYINTYMRSWLDEIVYENGERVSDWDILDPMGVSPWQFINGFSKRGYKLVGYIRSL